MSPTSAKLVSTLGLIPGQLMHEGWEHAHRGKCLTVIYEISVLKQKDIRMILISNNRY